MSRLLSKRALAAVALVVLVAAGVGASARGTGHTASGGGTATPTTLHEVAHDTSAPLQSKSQGPISMRIHAPMLPEWREQQQGTVAAVDDPLVQRAAGSTRMPAATRSFEGLALADAGGPSYLPPDPNGDGSTTHYVQAVNGKLAAHTKAGSRIAGPIANLDFWSGLGG